MDKVAMKKFDEFNDTEKRAIVALNDTYFVAEMSDDYRVTRSEQSAALKNFNKRFGYNFSGFSMNAREVEKSFFY